MSIGRVAFFVVGGLIIALLWVQMFLIVKEGYALRSEQTVLQEEIKALDTENSGIERDIEYSSQQRNLEKILRERFNYKRPGETMIIVVPQQ
jgi:cell division protein FtsB